MNIPFKKLTIEETAIELNKTVEEINTIPQEILPYTTNQYNQKEFNQNDVLKYNILYKHCKHSPEYLYGSFTENVNNKNLQIYIKSPTSFLNITQEELNNIPFNKLPYTITENNQKIYTLKNLQIYKDNINIKLSIPNENVQIPKPQLPTDNQLLSIKDVCQYLDASEYTIKNIPQSLLPFNYSNGGHRRYKLSDVMNFSIIKDHIPESCNITQSPKSSIINILNNPKQYNISYIDFLQKLTTFNYKGKIPLKNIYGNNFEQSINNANLNIINADRQMGKSTFILTFALYNALLNPNTNIAIFTINSNIKSFHCAELIKIINTLDPNIIKTQTKKLITFSNNSKISLMTPNPNLVMCRSFNLILFDEIAFLPLNIMYPLWTAIYPIVTSTKRKVIMASSPNPNHPNLFDMIYSGAFGFNSDNYKIQDNWNRIYLNKNYII